MADTETAGFDFKLYRYDPSLPAAVVSTVVFAVLSVLHTWRLIRVRAYYFTPFVIGGFCRSTNSPDYAVDIANVFFQSRLLDMLEEYGVTLTSSQLVASCYKPFLFSSLPHSSPPRFT